MYDEMPSCRTKFRPSFLNPDDKGNGVRSLTRLESAIYHEEWDQFQRRHWSRAKRRSWLRAGGFNRTD